EMRYLIPLLFLGCSWQRSTASTSEPPLHLLFIGNSYTAANDLPTIVRKMIAQAGHADPVVAASTPGGFTLEQHSHDPNTLKLLEEGPGTGGSWEVVVLQEQSTRPALAEVVPEEQTGLLKGFSSLCDRVKRNYPNAKIILYETWARNEETWQGRADAHF